MFIVCTYSPLYCAEELIGSGGAAEVYKGVLKGGQLVAIKRLTKGTHEEKVNSFLSELGIIVHVDHPNTAKLIGYGVEGGLHLVLQLSSHGSLSSFYGPFKILQFSQNAMTPISSVSFALIYFSFLNVQVQRRRQ